MKLRHIVGLAFFLACFWATIPGHEVIAQQKGTQAKFTKDKTLSFEPGADNFGVKVNTGQGLLFEIINHVGGDPRVDAGYSVTLTFALENPKPEINITSFKKEGVFIYRSCRCIDGGYNRVTSGKIHLKRLSKDQWQADIEVSAIGRRSGKVIPFIYAGSVYLADEEK